jgi:hypothetical protein
MDTSLYEYGLMVFNHEAEKFERWLESKKVLTDKEIKQELDKIEYGIFN